MVSRRNFLAASKKKLILVDHNEQSQAVNGMETAEIVMETGFNVASRGHKSVVLPGVVSRKKQMLPTISTTLE